ncbi:MAG: glucose-1-phosphate thymidylyltransferase [Armatimonadetes bacterium]|nr:glucose-1-phosphate thymidylyltransferase [Anaerolineae bacterium]
MKAIILAAGQGTRLRPVTLTMPKPLVPVANKALIVYAVEMLRDGGLHDIGIVVNNLRSPICTHLGDGKAHGVNIQYITQKEQLGLAHAVSVCREFVGEEPFGLFLGDNIFHDKMGDLIRNFSATSYEAAVALGEVADPTRFGIAEIQDNKIVRVVEKPKVPPSNLAISGVYLFRPSIFHAIANIQPSWRNELEITDAIQYLITQGSAVQAYRIDGWWIDAGKPDAIINANQFVLGDLPFTPAPEGDHIVNSDVSHRVILGEGTTVTNSVIRGPVILGTNVIVKDSYIGPYTSIGNNCVIEQSEIDASIVMKDCTIRAISGRIDSSLVADNSQVISSMQKLPAARRFVLAENSFVQL